MQPLPLLSAEGQQIEDSADLVIVGLGAAGAAAAIEAARAGLDVLVIERASAGGGSTAAAGGYIYIGGGTDAQKANGFEDDVESMIAYLTACMADPPHDKIHAYCEASLSHYEWLKGQGVPFNCRYYPGKHYEVPSDETLSWTGNEKVFPFRNQARPAPRGHMVAGEGASGHVLISRLIESATAAGARFIYDANVNALIRNGAGRVMGVRYRREGRDRTVSARRGVLLATGGFSMNKDMLSEFCPFMGRDDVHLVSGPYADGAGIRLGVGAGAALAHMDAPLITSPLYPPESYLKGVLVNKVGRRFIPEDSYHGRTAVAILQQPDQVAYLILDNTMYAPPGFGQQQLIDAWEDIAQMEKDLSMPEGELQRTIATYNRDAERGEDSEQHKDREWCMPLLQAPFAALDCSPGRSVWSGFTLGGLKTDIDARVLDKNGAPISGLYAAGATASNLAQGSFGYASGLCIGESTYFARRAAMRIARQE